MSLLLRLCAACLLVAFGQLGMLERARADASYEATFARALELDVAGDPAAAAALLEPLVVTHPDDYFLHLQLGWLYFQIEDYERAEAAYRRASELSGGGAECELGLGWVYLRTDRPREALESFERVLVSRPGDASALEGRGLASEEARNFRVFLDGSTTIHIYPGHPLKSWAIGIAPAIDARIARRWLVGATYRYAAYSDGSGGGGGGGWGMGGGGRWFNPQHQFHARFGYARPLYGVMAHVGWATDDVALSGETWVTGLTFRASPFGDIVGEGSVSFVQEETVVRGALSWALPATERLVVQPGASILRSTSGEVLPDVSLLLRGELEKGSLWLGGRYGRIERPAYLDLSLVYNTVDRMLGGAFAGVQYRADSGFRAYATYEWQALETPVETGLVRSNAHFLTLGFGGAP